MVRSKRNGNWKEKGSNDRAALANPTKIADARLKLIEKRRTEISDARLRLQQLENFKTKNDQRRQSAVVTSPLSTSKKLIQKSIGKNIVMKKDGSGKISLQTKKNKMQAAKKQSLLPSPTSTPRNNYNTFKVDNRGKNARGPARQRPPESLSSSPSASLSLSFPSPMQLTKQEMFRKTINNDLAVRMPPRRYNYSDHLNANHMSRNQFIWIKDSANEQHSMAMDVEEPNAGYSLNISPSTLRHASVLDRLNGRHSTTSKLARNMASVKSYKVYVYNLQLTVTQEDIIELFEDIGELISARFVKPGVAVVEYKHYISAKTAADVYHNRQLDGHPMKCVLMDESEPDIQVAEDERVLLPQSLTPPLRDRVHDRDFEHDREFIASSKRILKTNGQHGNNESSENSKYVPRPDIELVHKALFGKS